MPSKRSKTKASGRNRQTSPRNGSFIVIKPYGKLKTVFLLLVLIVAAALASWFALEPSVEKQRLLDRQSELLVSIEQGDGEIVLDERFVSVAVDFYDDSGGHETGNPAAGATPVMVNEINTEPAELNAENVITENAAEAESIIEHAAESIADSINTAAAASTAAPVAGNTVITGVGVLTIDKINVKLPVTDGVSEAQLKVALGHVPQTASVGGEGNAVIAGHRSYTYGHYFNRLDEVAIGDIIKYQPKGGEEMSFVVYEIIVAEPNDPAIFEQYEGERVLTLMTCTPIRVASHRLIVRAKLVC